MQVRLRRSKLLTVARMPKGRPPDPRRERRGTGNRPKRTENRPSRDVVPAGTAVPVLMQPPETLPSAVHEVWHAAVADLGGAGYLRPSFIPTLLAYCEAVYVHAQASLSIHRSGLVVKGTNGPMTNPMLKVQKDAAATILRYADALGMNPAARIRLALEEANTMSTLASISASLDARS